MDRPILFNGDMVRAILDGRKTQTRRPIDSLLFVETTNPDRVIEQSSPDFAAAAMQWVRCPYGAPGDRLWVRETWTPHGPRQPGPAMYAADGAIGTWLDDGGGGRFWSHHGWVSGHAAPDKRGRWFGKPDRWRPSIHMPRWASRLTLDILRVRVERLQDISEEDALAEGFTTGTEELLGGAVARLSARDYFQNTWQDIYGFASWDANPWVWVVTFARAEVRR
jgi:hypothetical protein